MWRLKNIPRLLVAMVAVLYPILADAIAVDLSLVQAKGAFYKSVGKAVFLDTAKTEYARLHFDLAKNLLILDRNACGPTLMSDDDLGIVCTAMAFFHVPISVKTVGNMKYVYVLGESPDMSIGFILDSKMKSGIVYPLPLPEPPTQFKSENIIDWFELKKDVQDCNPLDGVDSSAFIIISQGAYLVGPEYRWESTIQITEEGKITYILQGSHYSASWSNRLSRDDRNELNQKIAAANLRNQGDVTSPPDCAGGGRMTVTYVPKAGASHQFSIDGCDAKVPRALDALLATIAKFEMSYNPTLPPTLIPSSRTNSTLLRP